MRNKKIKQEAIFLTCDYNQIGLKSSQMDVPYNWRCLKLCFAANAGRLYMVWDTSTPTNTLH